MEEDWDLTAVVRGCSIAAKPSTTFTSGHPHLPSFGQHGFVPNISQTQSFSVLPPLVSDLIKPTSTTSVEDLHDLYKPFFFPKSNHHNPPLLSPTTQITPQPNFNSSHLQLHKHQTKLSTTKRSKKRKNTLKRVCQVPAESLSSDIWAWRKYGQKPIKGSPYPRGYYRCSSSKGCMARKQVERHRSDPGMFILTYTAEHNHPAPAHRNSLAGSTRLIKPVHSVSSPPSVTDGDSIKSPSSPEEVKEEKQSSPLALEEEEEAEFFGVCDTIVSDDFFVGLDGLAGEYFSGRLTASF